MNLGMLPHMGTHTDLPGICSITEELLFWRYWRYRGHHGRAVVFSRWRLSCLFFCPRTILIAVSVPVSSRFLSLIFSPRDNHSQPQWEEKEGGKKKKEEKRKGSKIVEKKKKYV